jgi:hypothetical protein
VEEHFKNPNCKQLATLAKLRRYKVSELSFKLALQSLKICYQFELNATNSRDDFFQIITYKQVANRPNRHEPRAVKRRP